MIDRIREILLRSVATGSASVRGSVVDSSSIRTGKASGTQRAGFSLAELLIVISTMAVLAAVVVPRVTQRAADTSVAITWNTLTEVRRAINDGYYATAFEQLPYPLDSQRIEHPQLAYLYVNPATFTGSSLVAGTPLWTYSAETQRGWNGPFLSPSGTYRVLTGANFTRDYGETGDPAPLDGWGQPIVLQQPLLEGGVPSATSRQYARLVSAGPNGVLETSPTVMQPLPNQIGDDLVLPLLPTP